MNVRCVPARGLCALAAAVLWTAPLLGQAPAPEHVALTGAKIIPVVGETIEKGTVLITRGKIAAVGKDVQVPYDARVFDVSGKVVFPGLIDAHTWYGLDVANERRPVTPQLDVADALDPSQLVFEEMLRLGVTCAHVMQGNNTAIGGVGRVVRPIGWTPQEMTRVEPGFVKLSVSPRSGADRMLQLALIREAFDGLGPYLEGLAERRYEETLKEENKEIDVGPAQAIERGIALIRAEDIDAEHANLLRLTGGVVRIGDKEGPKLFEPLGAFIHCGDAMDVGAAVEVAKKYGFFERTVLVLGPECYKAVRELKAAARPVVLPGELIYRERDPLTGKMRETFVPRVFASSGLLFALAPGSDQSLPERMLTYQAARCVREGMSREAALAAITLNAAKLLGLESRLGSIEVGKEADLVVFSGDPLDFNSHVEQVFIEGILAYERDKDVRLQRLLSDVPGEPGEKSPASGPTSAPTE